MAEAILGGGYLLCADSWHWQSGNPEGSGRYGALTR